LASATSFLRVCFKERAYWFSIKNFFSTMTKDLDGGNKLDLVRSLALGIGTSGALGSLAFTLQAGRNNGSWILDLLFSAWVLSPFIILIISCMLSRRWLSRARISLYIFTIGISVASLIFYGRLLSFSEVRPAYVFLVIPFISWIIVLPSYFFLKR
jgi:hypothetical protein